MDPRKSIKYGVGCIIADCLLLLEIIIGICKGEVTTIDIAKPLVLIIVIVIPVLIWIKSRRRR